MTNEQILPEPVRDLLAAVLEALDLPHPATTGDTEAHDRLLSARARHACIALRSVLDDDGRGMGPAWDAAYLRERLAEHPVAGYVTADQAHAALDVGQSWSEAVTLPTGGGPVNGRPAPAAQPGDDGYDHTKATWYTKPGQDMTDDEVNEARAYYQSIGSTSMEAEWLRRHGLPENYGDPAPEKPVHSDVDASAAELLAAAHDDYATARLRSEPQLPVLSPELAALAAEADALAESGDL
ncbi:hypothetical protein ACW4TU_18530 [Streptomyces sp. QTS52]